MTRLTLQNRITTMLITFSVLLISVFTVIQLNNQLNNIGRYNSYHANLSSIIVKANLETILRQADAASLAKLMTLSLNTLKEIKTIKEGMVFDADGVVTASTESSLIGSNVRYKDLNKWDGLANLQQDKEGRMFILEMDAINNLLYIYLPLIPNPQEAMSYAAKISFSLGNIQEAFLLVYGQIIISTIVIIILNILFGYLLSKAVVGPVKVLNQVTKIIASGNLSVRTDIHTEDELQELGETFNYMTEELIKMKERAENANPLTKLPGNIVIREEVEKRIGEDRKFVVIYCDLDNFKAFNDKYGIAKGDEAIRITADIFKEAARAKGNPEDFVGHEGGDDFILLTTPEKSQEITDFIIKEFDSRIRSLYAPDDLSQGYIISTARDGSIKHFPIMTISMAGVTNVHRTITSYGEVTNIAAEVKKKAKSIGNSCFVMDKRHS